MQYFLTHVVQLLNNTIFGQTFGRISVTQSFWFFQTWVRGIYPITTLIFIAWRYIFFSMHIFLTNHRAHDIRSFIVHCRMPQYNSSDRKKKEIQNCIIQEKKPVDIKFYNLQPQLYENQIIRFVEQSKTKVLSLPGSTRLPRTSQSVKGSRPHI
jgi:hypothetical protein